ncbi:peptidase C1B bleomycin hydrolase [Amylocystis lapponica]|nr:peptidase C1B bleomycin hydrolase [Amylocystis lapponica]
MGASPSKPATPVVSPVSVDEKRAIIDEVTSSFSSLDIRQCRVMGAEVSSKPSLLLARTILDHSNYQDALISRAAQIGAPHVFNTEVEFKTGPITNQKSSGRCWLFATTNVLRYNTMKKLNLEDFQLSQLNKSNYYLELSIQNAELPIDDRFVVHTASDLISDGGQWDMVVNLLEVRGLPRVLHSSLSGPLNKLLKCKLREHALVLRSLSASLGVRSAAQPGGHPEHTPSQEGGLMKDVYTVMSATLGVPLKQDTKFTWDYYDKDGKAGHWEGTPLEFYKTFATDKHSPSESFSLINDPRNEYGKLYSVDRLGNVWGGREVLYVNTEIVDLKNAIVKMIKAGQPVFFGCDVGQFSNSPAGIMDTALYDYGVRRRLQTGESAMTHAMVISGPVRYKGYFVMTDAWFVYQVVVPKAFAPKELVKVFESGEKTYLPLWDPMGALA